MKFYYCVICGRNIEETMLEKAEGHDGSVDCYCPICDSFMFAYEPDEPCDCKDCRCTEDEEDEHYAACGCPACTCAPEISGEPIDGIHTFDNGFATAEPEKPQPDYSLTPDEIRYTIHSLKKQESKLDHALKQVYMTITKLEIMLEVAKEKL